MTKPHEHKDLILKWADGAEIEAYDGINDKWVPATTPCWDVGAKYRVKPVPAVETKMTNQDLGRFCSTGGSWISDARDIANAAIARAIADGQVVTRDAYERMTEQLHVNMYEPSKEGLTFDDGGYRFAVTGDPASINSLMRFCGENSESKRAARDMVVAEAVQDVANNRLHPIQKLQLDLAAIIAKVKP
jgi:hypothetical protein